MSDSENTVEKAGTKRKLMEEENNSLQSESDENVTKMPKICTTVSTENSVTDTDEAPAAKIENDAFPELAADTAESENNDCSVRLNGNGDNKDIVPTSEIVDIILTTEHSSNKIDQSTNTEGEFVTDIEKLLMGFQADYQNLEIEEYKKMLQKFYTQNLRLATRCQKLKAAVEKSQTTTTRILREASKQVNPHQLAFISAQLINNGKSPNKRVWSPQMKNIMVGLFRVSPASFRFLSKVLVLPQEDEINQWISQGTECDLASEESVKEEGASTDSVAAMEAQAVLDEIAFENLMATLL